METEIIKSNRELNIGKLFAERQRVVGLMAKEMAEREFELFEFNLFISASGKKHLDKVTKSVKELRESEKKGKINLQNYEDIAEEF